jgi:hypothetical protein
MSEGEEPPGPGQLPELVDLEAYPLHRPGSPDYQALVSRCRADLESDGMYDLVGFLRPSAVERTMRELRPVIDDDSFEHRRRHNIWFLPPSRVSGVPADHPALAEAETANRTVCADQLTGSPVLSVYEWPGLRDFLAATMRLDTLHLMADPLARVNVMSYREGEALNWHFDRSEFTTTVLLQEPAAGGEFEFRSGLRSTPGADLDAVGALVTGRDPHVQRRRISPGTLTVFLGRGTAHRVAPTRGDIDRVIAVFSFYEQPGVVFSPSERLGFYGRT